MQLTPAERDRLLLFTAAELARSRRARGLLLNAPEATALVADAVAEAARDGLRLAEAVERGRSVLRRDEILAGVADIVTRVEVEAVFDDGSRLAVVTRPFGPSPGDGAGPERAGPGVVLPASTQRLPAEDDVVALRVTNTATTPVSVTSHFHFFEVNPRLVFDRQAAYGRRLAIAAGTAARFDPGETAVVRLTRIGGERVVIGFAGLVDGPLDAPGAREAAVERARERGYLSGGEPT